MAKTIVEMQKTLNEFVGNYESVKRRVDKGRVSKSLNVQELTVLFRELDRQVDELRSTVPTGREDISKLAKECNEEIREINKLLDNEYMSLIRDKVDDLKYKLDVWQDVLENPEFAQSTLDGEPVISHARQKLEDKYSQACDIRDNLLRLRNKQEENIKKDEERLAEIEDKMCEETNERLITQYNQARNLALTTIANKEVYSNHLFSCYGLLERIIDNVRYILDTSMSDKSESLGRAKVFLDIEKLASIADDPQRALAILKKIDEQIEALKKKIPQTTAPERTQATADALSVREKLLAERAAKKAASSLEDLNSLKAGEAATDNTIKTK